MANQVNNLSEEIKNYRNFQSKCESMLGSVLNNQNIIQQEIFLLKNHKSFTQEKPDSSTEKSVSTMTSPKPIKSPEKLSKKSKPTIFILVINVV